MADSSEKCPTTPHTHCSRLEDGNLADLHVVPQTASTLESGMSLHSVASTTNTTSASLNASLTVVGAFLSLFFGFGQMNSFGTFQAWYATHQLEHSPASTISWIGSLQLWVFFASGCPIGRFFDLYGPKYLMGIGALCYFVSIMLTSACVEYYQYILAQGVLFGLGVGLLFYPAVASVSTHYSNYRATALGIAVAGSSLGGVIYPIVLKALFESPAIGFSWGVRISGFFSGAGCLLATILVSTKKSPRRENQLGLEGKVGSGSGRSSTVTVWRCFELSDTIRDARFVLLAVGSSFVALGLFIPFFYIVKFTHHLSVPPSTSIYALSVMNAGGVLGRIAPSHLADRWGRFNLLIPSALFSGAVCLTLWLPIAYSNTGMNNNGKPVLGLLMTFTALYGFFSGAFISLITPCVAQISDPQRIGTKIGLLYSIISIPSLLGGPAAGALLTLERHPSSSPPNRLDDLAAYTPVIAFSGSTLILGSLFILLARVVMDRKLSARL